MRISPFFSDVKTFLTCLNVKKIRNGLGLIRSYYSAKRKEPASITHLPIALSIEPTTSCNLRCPQCPSGLRSFSRPTGMLELQTVEKILHDTGDTLLFLIFYFQGEPYLNPQFNRMVRMAADKKIYTMTSSNAHYFDTDKAEDVIKSGLSRLIISIDGIDQESYAHYRIGGKLHKVLEGTSELVKAKKRLKSSTPYIVWQFIVFKHNQHQLADIRKMAKQYGVDHLQIKTAQVYDYETGDQWIPDNPQYSRYEKSEGGIVFKNNLLNHCWKMWHSAVITWDGNVVPCCFDKDAQHKMGNIHQQHFEQIWNGETYSHFRKQLFKGRKEIDICKNCSEGTKVWV
jgi:radical SAM protein with 4Fe4S-binding SPASM domain